MKTVFMYAGQGSQKVSMGKDFYDEYESLKVVLRNFQKQNILSHVWQHLQQV